MQILNVVILDLLARDGLQQIVGSKIFYLYWDTSDFINQLDMIDKVLGFDQPAPRRRPNQATPQNTSKQEVSEPVATSASRSNARNFVGEEAPPVQSKFQEDDSPAPVVSKPAPPAKSKLSSSAAKPVSKQESRQETRHESEQQIASPAVKNLKVARVPKATQQMRTSGKHDLRASLRASEINTAALNSNDDTMYKLKLLAFIVVSFLMILYAMTPIRKAPGPKR